MFTGINTHNGFLVTAIVVLTGAAILHGPRPSPSHLATGLAYLFPGHTDLAGANSVFKETP